MKSRLALIAIILILIMAMASMANAQWYDDNKRTTLSVFAAKDTKSEESGFGASLTMYANSATDLTYLDLGSYRLGQFSKLDLKKFGPYPVYMGFAIARAEKKEEADDNAPDGTFSGIELILGKSNPSARLSLDFRVCSLSKQFDPIAWFSDPDIFWVGAGISLKF